MGSPSRAGGSAVFALGLVLLLLAVTSPLAAVGEEELFSFHMAQHVLLGDLAPLCLLAGLNGHVAPAGAGRVARTRSCESCSNPLVALPVWTLNLLIWHLAPFYEAAIENGFVHFLEHASFFTAGVIMWLPVLETLPAPEWFGTGPKLAYIVVVRLVETLLGNVFLWAGTPFYDVYVGGDELPGSVTASRSGRGRLRDDAGGVVGDVDGDRVAVPAAGRGG